MSNCHSNVDEFEINEFIRANYEKVLRFFKRRATWRVWNYFDPEDLNNEAFMELHVYVGKHRAEMSAAEPRRKMLWTIVNRLWIREIRRELRQKRMGSNGSILVRRYGELIERVADRQQRSVEVSAELFDTLEYLDAKLSIRQQAIVHLRLDQIPLSDIANELRVSRSTILRDCEAIKYIGKSSLGDSIVKQREPNENSLVATPTINDQRSTINDQRSTSAQPLEKH